jgi:glutamyl-tRNA reductase
MSIADLAIVQTIGREDIHGAEFLVVGTGEMGRRAVSHLTARGALVTISSRSVENARELARQFHLPHAPFDPGPDVIGSVAGVVVALAGPWQIAPDSRRSLLDATSWVIDLSLPSALDPDLPPALARRLISIDDLSDAAAPPVSDHLLERLDGLAQQALAQHEQWLEDEGRRAAADALTARARALRVTELDRLWGRLPTLDQAERDEVERTVEQITRLLLRDPLEQLGQDADGRQVQAARDLFRL